MQAIRLNSTTVTFLKGGVQACFMLCLSSSACLTNGGSGVDVFPSPMQHPRDGFGSGIATCLDTKQLATCSMSSFVGGKGRVPMSNKTLTSRLLSARAGD